MVALSLGSLVAGIALYVGGMSAWKAEGRWSWLPYLSLLGAAVICCTPVLLVLALITEGNP